MTKPDEHKEDVKLPLMRRTGRNAMIALLIGLVAAVLISVLMGASSIFFDAMDRKGFDLSAAVWSVAQGLKMTAVCVTPVVFLLTFALLQRIRLPW